MSPTAEHRRFMTCGESPPTHSTGHHVRAPALIEWYRCAVLRRFLLILLFALTTTFTLASIAHAQHYHVTTYTENDGLPSSTVNDITQDLSGRMWFATRFGIGMYDTHDWTTYDTGDGLPHVDQKRVMCDHTGRIWSIGQRCRWAFFENGSWTALPYFVDDGMERAPAAAVVPQQAGTLLLVAPGSGGVRYFKDTEWETLDLPGDPGDAVIDIAVDSNAVYLAYPDGVLELDPDHPENGARYHPGLPRRETLGIAVDRSRGTLWVGGPDYVGRLQNGRFEVIANDKLAELKGDYYYLSCEPDPFGGLYVGNPLTLVRYGDDGAAEELGMVNGLAAEGATSFFLDRENNMWVSSLRGVTKIISLRFANYTRDHGLQDDEVSAVLERRNGEFVLGHPRGFSVLKNGSVIRTKTLPERVECRVLDLAEDASGNVWAAVSTYGLAKLDDEGNIEWYTGRDDIDKSVTSVLVDRENRVWVTTKTKTFVGTNGRFVPSPQGVELPSADQYLRRLFETRDGAIYIASYIGLFVLGADGTALLEAEGAPRANNIYAFHEDRNGTIWAGSIEGLFRVENGKLVKAHAPGPQIDRPVYFIVSDGKDRLWFGTDNGVSRWSNNRIERFGLEDGLVGRETNRAAGVVDSDGHVWIGMDRGVSVYREKFAMHQGVPPLIELASVDVNGEIFPLDRDLRLGHTDNTLLFHFRALSFTDEKNVMFQCRLEGFDEEWLNTFYAPDREIRYTNLSPGTYRFHLRAAAPDGTWSETVSSSAVIINAPFWRKPYFPVAVLVFVGLAVWMIVGYISQRRYALRLENEVSARVDELRMVETELEKARRIESIGILAGGIAHDFNNMLTVMMGNLSLMEDHSDLEASDVKRVRDALDAANRARSLTLQLLTFSRGGAPVKKPGDITVILEELALFVTSGSDIECTIDFPKDLWLVDIDAGQMSQVINNICLNARQAMASKGVIHVKGRNHETAPRFDLNDGRYVEISIEDHGEGMAPEVLDRVFDPYFSTREQASGLGLTTAYSIVKRHGGKLVLESTPKKGTTCRIYLPASDGHTAEIAVEAPLKAGTKTGRVLIADDEKGIRDLVVRILARAGHDVESADDGAAAVVLYKKRLEQGRCFDVVILDLTIPGGLGGKEALKRLKKIDPRVTAIVASGYSNDPVIAEYADYGFAARVRKPFTANDLTGVVGRLIG